MDWRDFLEKCSLTVTGSEDLIPEYKSLPKNWLGYDPATPAQILQAEQKLNCKLPPSYIDFLLASNGFKQLSCFLWDFLPVGKIGWLSDIEPEFVEIVEKYFGDIEVSDEQYNDYSEDQISWAYKKEYLLNTLVVSAWGDAAIVLLNPLVKFGDEWEAWVYANWYPGARRFKSFEDLMLHEHQNYVDLIADK